MKMKQALVRLMLAVFFLGIGGYAEAGGVSPEILREIASISTIDELNNSDLQFLRDSYQWEGDLPIVGDCAFGGYKGFLQACFPTLAEDEEYAQIDITVGLPAAEAAEWIAALESSLNTAYGQIGSVEVLQWDTGEALEAADAETVQSILQGNADHNLAILYRWDDREDMKWELFITNDTLLGVVAELQTINYGIVFEPSETNDHPDERAGFRNTRWEMSLEEVEAAEQMELTEADTVSHFVARDQQTEYIFPGTIFYQFYDDRLYCAGYKYQVESFYASDTYDEIKDQIANRWGSPAAEVIFDGNRIISAEEAADCQEYESVCRYNAVDYSIVVSMLYDSDLDDAHIYVNYHAPDFYPTYKAGESMPIIEWW